MKLKKKVTEEKSTGGVSIYRWGCVVIKGRIAKAKDETKSEISKLNVTRWSLYIRPLYPSCV